MAMTVVDKDCTKKAECFVNTVAEANYERGFKDGYAKAIEEFAERIRGYSFGATEIIDRISTELKGE